MVAQQLLLEPFASHRITLHYVRFRLQCTATDIYTYCVGKQLYTQNLNLLEQILFVPKLAFIWAETISALLLIWVWPP